MKVKFLIASIYAVAIFLIATVIFSTYKVESQSVAKAHKQTERNDLPIVDLPADSKIPENEKPLREKRNKRYDLKDDKIDKSKLVFKESDYAEVYNLPISDVPIAAIPAYQSDAVIIGTVTDRKAFLSNDKITVYSEFTVQVEQVLKGQSNTLLTPRNTVAVQRRGGAVRLPSGKIIRRGAIFETMPLSEKRYLFFLESDKESESFQIVTGYQLRNGQVFPLDGVNPPDGGRKVKQFAVYEGMNQDEFLKQIQNELTEQEGGKDE